MKKFLAVFTGSKDGDNAQRWQALSEEERQRLMGEGMQAWGAWMAKHSDAVVDAGGPLGITKLVDGAGVSDINNAMSAYIMVQAEDHAAAAAMFIDHPHFRCFPGDGVEVMECMPMPGGQ